MADNLGIDLGTEADVATDDVAGVHYQKLKVDLGGDGASSPLVRGQTTKANALPVTLASDEDALGVVEASAADILIAAEAIQTAVEVIDNAIGGTEMQVDVVAALPAGTNAIGKLAANSGVDIGDVDVASVIPGTGATALGKAEDAGHSTGDVGVMALAVRAASPTERSAGPTDGDYEPLAVNEVGAAWVSPTPSANGGASTMNATGGDGSTALTNSAQAIKAAAGKLLGYFIYNPDTAVVFIHFYNVASGSVTVGTTNPLFTLAIPAGSAANLWMSEGAQFSTAISWAATSVIGTNTAPGTAAVATCWYK